MLRLVTAQRDIDLRPGDVLVVETDDDLSEADFDGIRETARSLGVEALVFERMWLANVATDDIGTPIYDALMAERATAT